MLAFFLAEKSRECGFRETNRLPVVQRNDSVNVGSADPVDTARLSRNRSVAAPVASQAWEYFGSKLSVLAGPEDRWPARS